MAGRGSGDPSGSASVRAAFAVLGLSANASERAVQEARRRLAKSEHPDVGGSDERMRSINEAADVALASIGRRRGARSDVTPPVRRRPSPGVDPDVCGPDHHSFRDQPSFRDHPSFTVEALPVEAHEALRIVASWLGDVVDDDPPYCLDMVFADRPGLWCRLDLVPDAGSSTVSITASADDRGVPDVAWVRDSLIDALNRLDWSMLEG